MKQVAQKNEVNWKYIGQACSTYSPAQTYGMTQCFKPFPVSAEIKQRSHFENLRAVYL
jgi:hypothetical protein